MHNPNTMIQRSLPNIVLIFLDDMGYADLGCYGAKGIRTPHLDRMAAEGVRFTDFYVAQPVCSASRAALLTGCYSNRIGMTGALGPNSKIGLHPEEKTIAALLKPKGYATGMVGKWHLGHLPPFLPTNHGFDSFYGIPYSHDMWPRHPESPKAYPILPLMENERVINPDLQPADIDQLTEQYTERAVRFIEENHAKPFFLYLAHNLPHVPLGASYRFRGRSKAGRYGDVIEELDASVGAILETLKRNDLDRDTLVIFTSDNGPWLSYGEHSGSAGPLREGKGTNWEGGVRVPFIARWPGKIRPKSVIREPAMTIDILPTLARLVDAPLPPRPIDGKDMGPLLLGDSRAKSPQQAYFFYYNRNDLQAVRSGQWKLMLPQTYRTLGANPERAVNGIPVKYTSARITEPELYDLAADTGEKRNVAARHPDVLNRLLALAARMRADLGDGETIGPGARAPGRVDS